MVLCDLDSTCSVGFRTRSKKIMERNCFHIVPYYCCDILNILGIATPISSCWFTCNRLRRKEFENGPSPKWCLKWRTQGLPLEGWMERWWYWYHYYITHFWLAYVSSGEVPHQDCRELKNCLPLHIPSHQIPSDYFCNNVLLSTCSISDRKNLWEDIFKQKLYSATRSKAMQRAILSFSRFSTLWGANHDRDDMKELI